MPESIITTTSGQIRGTSQDGILRYLGVPYAAAPIGDRRFALPVPPDSWPDIRDCSTQGATCPQRIRDFPGINAKALIGDGPRPGDNPLNVNIWAPANIIRKAPVMVFIHGGAFCVGGNDAPVQDGSAFARSGIVLMAINYRLGVEGFLPIPGVPTNLGLRDQILALKWVRDNAGAFDGDPQNITLFGESAGAMSVAYLMASPLAKGLFRRAILESGHGALIQSPEVGAKIVRRVAKFLKISPDLTGFRTTTIEQGLDALQNTQKPSLIGPTMKDKSGRDPSFGITRFLPVYGDDVLPEIPLTAVANGAGSEIDLLIGTNREEGNLYMIPTGVAKKLRPLLATWLLSRVQPQARRLLKAYGMGKGSTAGEAFTAILGDLVFRLPARQFAGAHRGHTHVYEFNWRSPAINGQLGACHGLELPFVFNTLASCAGPNGIAGEAPPQDLADRIHKLWVDFATNGQIPWPEYTDQNRQVGALETLSAAAATPLPAESFH